MAEKRRSPEIIAGRVNVDGSIAAGDGFTVVKGAAGIYTITLAPGFRLVAVTVSAHTAGAAYGAMVTPQNPSGNSFGVQTMVESTSALADQTFGFIAVGVQT